MFHVVPRYSRLFHAVPRYSSSFHAIPDYSTLFHIIHVIQCYSMLFRITPCYSMLFHISSRYSTRPHVLLSGWQGARCRVARDVGVGEGQVQVSLVQGEPASVRVRASSSTCDPHADVINTHSQDHCAPQMFYSRRQDRRSAREFIRGRVCAPRASTRCVVCRCVCL